MDAPVSRPGHKSNAEVMSALAIPKVLTLSIALSNFAYSTLLKAGLMKPFTLAPDGNDKSVISLQPPDDFGKDQQDLYVNLK